MDFALIWAVRFGLMALLITPLIVSPSTIFPFIVGKALFSRSVIEITFALWLILALRRPEYRPARSNVGVLMGLFVLATLISAIFGVSFQRSIWSNYERMTGVFDLFHWWLLLIMLMTVIKGTAQWRLYLSAFLGVGLFISILGLLQANEVSWSAFSWLRGQEIGRLTISLGNATYVGSLGMSLSLIGLGLFMDRMWRPVAASGSGASETVGRKRRRVRTISQASSSVIQDDLKLPIAALYLVIVAAGMFIIFGSGSRGSMVGLLAGMGVIGAVYSFWGPNVRWRLAARIGTALLVLALVGFIFLRTSAPDWVRDISPLLARSVGSNPRDPSTHSRGIGTRAALQAFAERPITGYGAENYSTIWNNHLEDDDFLATFPELDVAHNDPAEILGTTGILGFLPYSGFWLFALWFAYRRVRANEESQWIDIAILGAIVGFFTHLLFLFDTASTMLVLTIILAYAGATELRVAMRAAVHMPGDFLAPRGSAPTVQRRESSREARAARRRRERVSAQSSLPGTESWSGVVRHWLAPIVITTVLILSLIFTQLQPWRAAQKVLIPGTPQEVVQNLDVFSQLGTISRTQFMDVIASELPNIDPNDRAVVFGVVEPEVDIAIRDEPENMKVRLAAARLYRSGAINIPQRHDELMALAREQTNEGLRIGPFVYEANVEVVSQAFAEQSLPKIEAAVANWQGMSWGEEHRIRWDRRLEDARASLAP